MATTGFNRALTPSYIKSGLAVNPYQSYFQKGTDYFNGLAGLSNGTGSYGTWTNPTTGQSIGLDQAAYNAIQNSYTSDGTALNFNGAQQGGFQGLGGIDTAVKGAQALAGLANAYLGYKNYKMAKDQFGFEKAATNRNFGNQASEYNTGIQNAGEVGMSLAGNTMTPEQRAQYQTVLDSRKLSTAAIG